MAVCVSKKWFDHFHFKVWCPHNYTVPGHGRHLNCWCPNKYRYTAIIIHGADCKIRQFALLLILVIFGIFSILRVSDPAPPLSWHRVSRHVVNTLIPEKNGRHFAHGIFKCNSINGNYSNVTDGLLELQLAIIQHYFIWCRGADQMTSVNWINCGLHLRCHMAPLATMCWFHQGI